MTAPKARGSMSLGTDASWSDADSDSRAAATSDGVISGYSICPDAALEATKLFSFYPRGGAAGG